MNEQTRNAIDMAYAADIAGMQSAIEDLVKTKVLDALEGKKQEVAKEIMNSTNEEKCCDELSSKQKKEMDVDDDEDIDEKDLKSLRNKKKLKKEEVEDLEEKISPSMGSEKYIKDFVHSDNPRFEGKSKKERIQMALGAYYSAKKGKTKNEEVSEGLELTKKKTMYKNPALPGTFAADRASGKFKKTLKKLNTSKGK